MPLGRNRSDPNAGGTSYRSGTPINTATLTFGNPVTLPKTFGNAEPSNTKETNVVTWTPAPGHFGNTIP